MDHLERRMNPAISIDVPLPYKEWNERARHHASVLTEIVEPHRLERTLGRKHPVYDFLFSYYSFSRGQLLRWSPGINVMLDVGDTSDLPWDDFYRIEGRTAKIDICFFPERRIPYLDWAISFLKRSYERPPTLHCFGLHEWGMVYRSSERHHPEVPLRVSEQVLEVCIEENQLCCTHYDAFRFFTPQAKPQNKFPLERESVPEYEQPGCIHANMDLYKYGYKIAPFISSDLLRELFFLARKAREIDMRASPYDLSEYGFSPISVETKEGRETYVREQRSLYSEAQPLRIALLETYQVLRAEVLREKSTSLVPQPEL
jgi:hypothetical protein